MMKELEKIIAENRAHQKRWDKLIDFLMVQRDEARRKNNDASGYERTISKVIQLFND